MPRDSQIGKVYLVGAGPGDPELITLKGARLLKSADIVLYDALVNPALFEHCAKHTRFVDVGKRGYGKQVAQETTNKLLVQYAGQGLRVVRLKGGDPFVFGRGGEEALALSEAGIEFEVVPGISSAIAAPLLANIPVTHRGVASQVTFITGSAARSDIALQERWVHLARAGGTLVFLMPMRHLENIAARLQEGGLSHDTSAALVHRASQKEERVITATLSTISHKAREEELPTPSVLVVGDVVDIRRRLLSPTFTELSKPHSSHAQKELQYVSL